MAEKSTQLSIVIRTVDQATAKLKAINERIDEASKPVRDFKKQLGELAEKSGLSGVVEGFKGVGEAAKEVLFKFVEAGAIIGEVTHLVLELAEQFEMLGKTAERAGVSVDFLAGMRYAAGKTGVAVEQLDSGLQAFNQSLGQARAGTGRMASFLERVNPAFLKQLKGAKSNEEAFDDLAVAMSKLTDPAKRAALAQKTLGDAALAPLFAQGPEALKELRDHFIKVAGPQQEAVDKATELGESMKELHLVTDGFKVAIITGLAPALKIIVDRLSEWFTAHKADVAAWVKKVGEELPGAVQKVVEWIGKAYDKVRDFLDSIGGVKTVLIAMGAITLAPLATAVIGLVGSVGKLASTVGLVDFGPWGLAVGAVALAISGISGMLDEIKGKTTTKNELAIEASANRFKAGGYQPTGVKLPDDVFDLSGQARAAVNDVSGQARAALEGGRSPPARAQVTVDFANAPRGTRVKTDPQSTADVDLSVGYQMGLAP